MRFEKKQAEDQYIKMATVPFTDTSMLEQPDPWVENLYDQVITTALVVYYREYFYLLCDE